MKSKRKQPGNRRSPRRSTGPVRKPNSKPKSKKRTKKPAQKRVQKRAPKNPKKTYQAFINKKGKRVKAGTRGARAITVKINRESLKKSATRAGRIKGKFAPIQKARKSERSKIAARKATLTRALKDTGSELVKDYLTDVFHFRYREYFLSSMDPEVIRLILEREQIEGAATVHVRVDYVDADGQFNVFMSNAFAVNPDNADAIAENLEQLSGQYEVEEIDEMTIRFRYARHHA